MSQLGFHSKQFADKVKNMNQTNKQNLTLTANEARNLLNDIFDLQSQIVSLSAQSIEQPTTIVIDNGTFR